MQCSYTTFLINHPETRPECVGVPINCHTYPECARDKLGAITKWASNILHHEMSRSGDMCHADWYSCLLSGEYVAACCIATRTSAAALRRMRWRWYVYLLIWPVALPGTKKNADSSRLTWAVSSEQCWGASCVWCWCVLCCVMRIDWHSAHQRDDGG